VSDWNMPNPLVVAFCAMSLPSSMMTELKPSEPGDDPQSVVLAAYGHGASINDPAFDF
jgi:hypothetical protein